MNNLTEHINIMTDKSTDMKCLVEFLEHEVKVDKEQQYEKSNFIGYVLDIGYDAAKIITSDTYKINVGGIPRGSYLIMVPNHFDNVKPHYCLLRVSSASTTPLSNQVQHTYFELHKRAMPQIDIWTMNELQWGALECDILGMYHLKPNDSELFFSGDINNIVSPHRYKVFKPNNELLEQIVNGTLGSGKIKSIGKLRTMECMLESQNKENKKIDVSIAFKDFRGYRTAMFGKTRLGKSNVVKLLAKSMLDFSKVDKSIGQVIFDLNGEYANDNPQDGDRSLRSAFEDRTQVYALTNRENTPSKTLRLNFYLNPQESITILKSMIENDGKNSIYIKDFYSSVLPSFKELNEANFGDKNRMARKILIFWSILYSAGFEMNENELVSLMQKSKYSKKLDPHFNKELREAAGCKNVISNIDDLRTELKKIYEYYDNNPDSKVTKTKSGKDIFDSTDKAMLKFLFTTTGAGATILAPYKIYHSDKASDFIAEILMEIDEGKTVILDLGNATDTVRRYFSDMISQAIFSHQEKKFVDNKLGEHYVQLYFEEAHNLFPSGDKDLKNFYARFAKEGAKFHVGMVYSTQSPSTISKELLAQTENFFVGHLSSVDEVNSLSRMQIAFDGVKEDILKSKTPGYMRMITHSHRFVVPFQADLFKDIIGG